MRDPKLYLDISCCRVCDKDRDPADVPSTSCRHSPDNAVIRQIEAVPASLLEERDRELADVVQEAWEDRHELEVLRAQLTEAREALERVFESMVGLDTWTYKQLQIALDALHERPIVPSPKLGVSQSLEPATEEK